jgi:3-oxoadipate enol-lactonase
MPKIEANGNTFNYELSGPEGAPWITFSNSLMTNLHMWDEQAELLSNDWQVLRYDQRGHGASNATPPPYDFDLLGEDVIAIWNALGVKRSVFCGLSMGGATGLGLCLNHADRLSAFVGCDMPYQASPEFAALWDQRMEMARQVGIDGMAMPTAERWFVKSFVDAPQNQEVIEKICQMVRTTSMDGYVGCCNALQKVAFAERMDRVNVPTFFISGSEDPAANPTAMKPLVDAVSGAEIHIIPNCGHISNMENPESFNGALLGFLNQL